MKNRAKFLTGSRLCGILIVFFCVSQIDCRSVKVNLPAYPEFTVLRQQALSPLVMELYGRYSAKASGKSIRASYNLLLDPGKSGYLEILDPSKQLVNSISLTGKDLTVFWTKSGTYIQEPATPENLNAAIGLPLLPDDLLLLLAGVGLNFSEWKPARELNDGWELAREQFTARLTMKMDISRIRVFAPSKPYLNVIYEDYEEIDNRLLPRKIRFEVPDRKLFLELRAEKILFRDEPAEPELFAVQLQPSAQKIPLKEIYRGKPLLLEN